MGPRLFAGLPPDGVFRVGDAGAVGDPFMGEGIGRALATGALLRAALREVDDRPLVERYRALWSASYGGRFAFGLWARRLLLNHRLTPWTLRPLLSPWCCPGSCPSFTAATARRRGSTGVWYNIPREIRR
ncbi:MAG: hypothetical protein IPP68_05660 [Elusimicrobia bacterium]|nr:hypothetical protein [Elusimicrobiota bacterium]